MKHLHKLLHPGSGWRQIQPHQIKGNQTLRPAPERLAGFSYPVFVSHLNRLLAFGWVGFAEVSVLLVESFIMSAAGRVILAPKTAPTPKRVLTRLVLLVFSHTPVFAPETIY